DNQPHNRRGPCPALNALANHNYLPRSGLVNMLTMPNVVNEVFGMGTELGLALSLYATLLSGDILTLSWSIGDSHPSFLSPLLGGGKGLSGSHNKYETDASVTHGDYYLFDGDVNFKKLLSHQENEPDPNYDLDVMIKHRKFTLQDSISTNPQFFYGPFSGLLVSNAGHCFVPGMFSNFTKDYPQGNLSKEILMSIFAVYENPVTGIFTHKKGWERIPDNWYRRPPGGLIGDYGTVAFAADFVKMALKVPQLLKVGGNTGKVNSFVGVDLGDLTGGIYNALDLLDPAKLVCFIFRLLLVAVPDLFQGGLVGNLIKIALNLLTKTLVPLFDPKCPGIQQWNSDLLKDFPGAGAKAL
ncbi:Chloroperoxidase, partial [Trichophaea hybrida]